MNQNKTVDIDEPRHSNDPFSAANLYTVYIANYQYAEIKVLFLLDTFNFPNAKMYTPLLQLT